jgi:hypothetical protein
VGPACDCVRFIGKENADRRHELVSHQVCSLSVSEKVRVLPPGGSKKRRPSAPAGGNALVVDQEMAIVAKGRQKMILYEADALAECVQRGF